jgi:dipeptidyl aminopeptidase/acylaminoacyl peptidase
VIRTVLRAAALAFLVAISTAASGQQAPSSRSQVAAASQTASPLAVGEALITLREAAGMSVSPSGRFAAYQMRRADIASNSYASWWEVVSLNDGRRTHVDDNGGAPSWGRIARDSRPSMFWTTLSARWSPDEKWIGYLKSANGEVQIWRAHVDGSGAEQVTHDPGDVIDFVWSADGRSIIYSSGPSRAEAENERAAERDQGFLFDDRFDAVESWEPTRTHTSAPSPCCRVVNLVSGQTRAATNDEGAYFGGARPLPPNRTTMPNGLNMWTARTQGAPPPKITPTPLQPPRSQWERRETDGSSILLAFTDAAKQGMRGPMQVFAQAAAGAPYIPCTHAFCNGLIDEAWRSPSGAVIYERREGWDNSDIAFYAWRPIESAPRRLLSSSDHFFDCGQARDRLVCFREGPTTPQTLVSIDMITGATRRIVDFNPEFERASDAGEKLQWSSPAGNPDYGYFFRPRSGHGPYPLVIVQYRAFGFLRGGQGDYSPVQAYTRAGIAVLCIDRVDDDELYQTLTDDIEIAAREWRGLRQRRDNQGAIDRVLNLLVRRGDVDPSRIGISGLSDGSVATGYAIAHSKRFRAASISGGSWDPIEYYLVSPFVRRVMDRMGMGMPGSAQGSNWNDISMSMNAASIDTPLLVQTADRELTELTQPIVTLQALHKPVEAYVFSDEYHVMWQPIHRLALYRRNIDWFRFWLQDYEDPSPEKAAQYARWRAMRDALPRR